MAPLCVIVFCYGSKQIGRAVVRRDDNVRQKLADATYPGLAPTAAMHELLEARFLRDEDAVRWRHLFFFKSNSQKRRPGPSFASQDDKVISSVALEALALFLEADDPITLQLPERCVGVARISISSSRPGFFDAALVLDVAPRPAGTPDCLFPVNLVPSAPTSQTSQETIASATGGPRYRDNKHHACEKQAWFLAGLFDLLDGKPLRKMDADKYGYTIEGVSVWSCLVTLMWSFALPYMCAALCVLQFEVMVLLATAWSILLKHAAGLTLLSFSEERTLVRQ